jgi:hypothetical protein
VGKEEMRERRACETKEIRVKGRNARKWDSAERKTCGKGEFRIKIGNARM